MPSDDPYARAADKYTPRRTCVLFVAEAPPRSVERYFYFEDVKRDDWLWIALMKALYPSEWRGTKTERPCKRDWLVRFQKSGFRVIDALKEPVCSQDKKRIAFIKKAAPELIAEIDNIMPKQIVLVKSSVHQALFQNLRDAHLPVVNEKALPFPASGNQNRFHKEFRLLVDGGKLRLCSACDVSPIENRATPPVLLGSK